MQIDSSFLLANKVNFPWVCLNNAFITEVDGTRYLVVEVITRPASLGPLFTLKKLANSEQKTFQVNLSSFENGRFILIEVSAENAHLVGDFKSELDEKITAESNKKALEEKAKIERIKKIDSSRCFDLLLFDLDNTLVASDSLRHFRGRENVGNKSDSYTSQLLTESKKIKVLIPEAVINQIRQLFPSLRIGIFTRAPAEYSQLLLASCYPRLVWDCIVTYESALPKPSPDGITKASKITSVFDFSRIVYVGDDVDDIRAAYQAGIYSVLFKKGWVDGWYIKSSRAYDPAKYIALHLHPDALIDDPKKISDILQNPKKFMLTLESSASNHDAGFSSNRIDSHNCFHPVSHEHIKVYVMGRYFPLYKSHQTYNFSAKRYLHDVSAQLIKAKETNSYPFSWIEQTARYIKEYFLKAKSVTLRNLIVTCIPAKSNRPKRMEHFLHEIERVYGQDENVQFIPNIFIFKDGVISNKELDAKKRFENIKNNLGLSKLSSVRNFDVIVLDDIVTSGATLYYAHEYLMREGAASVHCLALAQTV